ncbi:MAG: FKBP-type peptidyl-prolyl cis-trans isomerase [Verrucomicrobiales bacterium]|nr:FKBP-type peptidyl-prolyl cis-trans isomerase [Verrucomicrobiales bacterium]
MRKTPFRNSILAAAFLAVFITPISFSQDPATAAKGEKTFEEQISYSYGVSIAKQLKGTELPIDKEVLKRAIDHVFTDQELEMSADEIEVAVNEARRFIMEKDVKDGPAKENLDAGKEFLKENAKKEGVVTTNSGLQYEVIKKGDGEKPAGPEAEVTVHYTGTLLDGTKFDSSLDRGEPANFPLNGVIRGWTEGVQLMPEGSKYKFYIPYYLAYGPGGKPGAIPPYAMLTFEIELLNAGN